MAKLLLVVGNKTYSSWSLRPWLALKQAGVPFDEEVVPLYLDDTKPVLRARSKAGKVPILIDGDLTVWDSLSILEYVAGRFPQAQLWPEDTRARAVARSICAEMHSGFASLRNAMPMNVRKSLPGGGHTAAALADVARVQEIWTDCRRTFGSGGPFLFGSFTNADAMFAPVVSRFKTYGVAVSDEGAAYCASILALPAMQEWEAAARAEPWTIEAAELDATHRTPASAHRR